MSRNSLLGRGAARKTLYRLVALMHPGPIDFPVWGARVRMHHRHNLTERKALMRPDRVDPIELSLITQEMATPGSVFVDVGANAGYYVLHTAMSAAARSRIVALEPSPTLIERMKFNIAAAREADLIAGDIEVLDVEVAVSDRAGEAVLSDVGDEGSRALVGGSTGLHVRCARLADVLDDLGIEKIDVVKIDVEGYEDRVLSPYFADVSASRWPRLIVIEHVSRGEWKTDCIEDCLGRGYQVTATTNNNTMLSYQPSQPD